MKIAKGKWAKPFGWVPKPSAMNGHQLVLVFGARSDLHEPGATNASRISHQAIDSVISDLELLINCIGRKFTLRHRLKKSWEECEMSSERIVVAGFGLCGENCSLRPGKNELHDQTMTITTQIDRQEGIRA